MHASTRTRLVFLLLVVFSLGALLLLDRNQPEPNVPLADQAPAPSAERPAPVEEVSAPDMEVFQSFRSWIDAWQGGQRGDAFLQQGMELAEARRETMLELLRRDGGAALRKAMSYSQYASLPGEMRELVEQPFSSTGDVLVTAICDHDHHTPQYHVNVYLEDRRRLRLGPKEQPRTGLSKLDVPIQGIQLDGWAALQPTVFEPVQGADALWAMDNLLAGNPDPEVDFLTGEALGPNPLIAIAGGSYFLFSNEDTLAELEGVLRAFDDMPGKTAGSSAIFSEIVQVQAKGFPIEAIRNSQKQIAIEDTTGPKTSFFIRAVFSDKPDVPISKADLEDQINTSVSNRLDDFSYGQTSMTATVSEGIYTVSMESGEYAFTGNGDEVDEQDLFDEALALYQADVPGDPYDTYDIVGVVFPKIDGVGWAGLGTVGGAKSRHWLNGVASTQTIVHEFGHNYGLKHSNYWAFNKNGDSTNPVEPDTDIAESEEYGDLWDVMGDGDENRGHFHMAAKRYLNWLGEDNIETISGDGTYTRRIYRFDHKDASAQALQGLEIAKDDGENYWVGFRRAYESNANYYRGAYILWERPANAGGDPARNQGWIIDTTPQSDGERQDAGINLGRTYSDTTAQVHITPITVGGSSPDEYLDVVVNIGAFAGNSTPAISNPVFPETAEARTPVIFSIEASDSDPNDDLAYSWDLADGQVYPSAASINAIFPVGGTYEVTVTVSDMKGGTDEHSSQVIVSDPVNNWTTRTSGVGQSLNALTNNGSIAVAVGDFSILTSPDGDTWTKRDPGILNYILNDVVWTGSEFLAAGLLINGGNFANGILSSPDGITWQEEYQGSEVQSDYRAIASNEDGSLVIAVTEDGLISVRDGEGSWSDVDFDFPATSFLGVAYGNGVFVIGGHDQVNNLLILKRTADGKNFADLVDNADLPEWTWLDNMEFHNGLFLGGGFFANIQFSENGGLSWRSLLTGQLNMETFAYGSGVFYAIGEDMDNGNELVNLVSSNGKNWSFVSGESEEAGNDIHFFNNSFIIVGDNGLIRQSGLVEAADEVLAAPVIMPEAQNFPESINVSMSTDAENGEIRYTLDGSEPDAGSTLYENPIVLTETTTVKAKVFKGELDPSPTTTVTYTKQLSAFDSWIAGFDVGDQTDASDNPDGDWASNLFEWAVGDVPDSGDSAPDAPELSFNGEGKAVFKIHRLSKSEDVTLTVEKSMDMVNWALLATTATTDSATLLELVANDLIPSYPCFLRIKASD